MKLSEKFLTAFFAIVLPGLSLPNQQDYIFSQLTIEDGLSQSTVFTSLQDETGFIWFGTSSGLNKFDGYTFTNYLNDPDDSSSIAGEVIVSLFEDADSVLWIGTVEGNINRYNRLIDSFKSLNISDLIGEDIQPEMNYYEYPLSFSRNHNLTITSIIEDDDGNIWLGTWGNGIIVIDKKFNKVNHFYHARKNASSLKTNRVTKLIKDTDGIIWIGTFGGGLSKCIKNTAGNWVFVNYSSSPSEQNKLSDDKIITLLLDSKSNVWIGTFYGGLNLLTQTEKHKSPDQSEFKRYEPDPTENSISNKTVMALCEDRHGQIWIGTFGSGLDKLNPAENKFINFMHNPSNPGSLADNEVLSLSIERSGIIWAGSHLGAGITKIQKRRAKFNLISASPGSSIRLSDDVVWSVYQDMEKVLWVGTYRGGLNRIDRVRNEVSYFNQIEGKNSISSNHIRSIAEDKFGNIWVGTYDAGISIINKRDFGIKRISANYNNEQKLNSNQIQSILILDDEYWIGTFGGGINYINSSENLFNSQLKMKSFVADPADSSSLSDNRVYKIFRDSKGILWICTFGGGLNKYDVDSGKFTHYFFNPDDEETIGDNRVISINEDSDGFLWVGTYGGGLNKLDPSTGKFERYSRKEGLTSNVIYGILQDDNQNLWLSSDNGIYKFEFKSKKFIRFDIIDGLQSREFSGGCYFKSSQGELFFGGIKGLNHFYADSIRNSTYEPTVVVTKISVLNEKLPGNPSEILLTHDQNFITFEFASMDYSNPRDNLYTYMLEGFDKSWHNTTGDRRMANYTNLPPGNYTFRVKGTNSDGIWSSSEAAVSILVNPPFWQTWWFITLSVLCIGSLIYYISTLRIKNLLAIEKLKTKLAADLHDNVGSGLTEISILSELAAFKSNSANHGYNELKKISELSRQLVDNMSDIVWVVNPQRDSLHDLIVRLKNSYGETLNSLGITFNVSNLENLKEIKLPIDFKQNLYLILKEAINNAIKHSKCSSIRLSANTRTDFIEISVSDDGIGMDENKIISGNGIKNIKQRAESIGGRVKWKSGINKGTTVRFVGKRSALLKLKTLFNKN